MNKKPTEEQITRTRKYIAELLDNKERRAHAAAKITELDDGTKEPPREPIPTSPAP